MIESIFFYSFSGLAVIGAIALVLFQNPVNSAMSMVAAFVGLAALFIGLNAYFVGIIQILVYAGAIMVLFLFIIMLLDLQAAERPRRSHPLILLSGTFIPLIFLGQLCAVLPDVKNQKPEPLALQEAAEKYFKTAGKAEEDQSEIYRSLKEGSLPDVNLVGLTMFGHRGDNASISTPGYNFPLQVVGVLLLVATVGVVALSLKKKGRHSEDPES